MADDPLGYGSATDSGFFDFGSNPQGPGSEDKSQDADSGGHEYDSHRDAFDVRQKMVEDKYEKWDNYENVMREQSHRYFKLLQEDKNLKPPVPMAHPAPPDMDGGSQQGGALGNLGTKWTPEEQRAYTQSHGQVSPPQSNEQRLMRISGKDIDPEDARALQRAGMGAIATHMPMTTMGGLRNRMWGLPAMMGGIMDVINRIREYNGKGPLFGMKTAHQKFAEAYAQWKENDKLVSEYNADQIKSYKEILANKKLDEQDQLEAMKTLAAIYKDPVAEANARIGDFDKTAKYVDNMELAEQRRKRGVSNLDAEAFKMATGLPDFRKYALMVWQKSKGKYDLMDEAHFKQHLLDASKEYPMEEVGEEGKVKHIEGGQTQKKPKVTADDLQNILEDTGNQ